MAADPITVLIRYQARPGKEDDALALLSELIATVVREEPDCLGIELLTYESDRGRILLYESWTSREAYLGPHFQTPHLKAFIEAAPASFAEAPDIAFWERHAVARRG